jgi:hypothetical protein
MLRHRLGFFLQKCIAARSSRRAAYFAALIGRMQCGPQLTCSALAGCVSRAGAEFFLPRSLVCPTHFNFASLWRCQPATLIPGLRLKKHEALTPPALSISSSCSFQDLPLGSPPVPANLGEPWPLRRPSPPRAPSSRCHRESVHALNGGGGKALA